MNTPDTHPTTPNRRLHPLIAAAAAGIIIASLAATAAITGLFPKASSAPEQSGQTQAAMVTPAPTGPAANPSTQTPPAQTAQEGTIAPTAQDGTAAAPVAPPPQYGQQPGQYAQQPPADQADCSSCGTVEAISAVRHEGHGTGIGAVGGAVAGGLIGNQFGAGGGRTAMTLLGALGGGFAGNSVEKHLRSTTSYSVRVRMASGKTRYFTYHEPPPFQDGQPVRVEHGTLVAG